LRYHYDAGTAIASVLPAGSLARTILRNCTTLLANVSRLVAVTPCRKMAYVSVSVENDQPPNERMRLKRWMRTNLSHYPLVLLKSTLKSLEISPKAKCTCVCLAGISLTSMLRHWREGFHDSK